MLGGFDSTGIGLTDSVLMRSSSAPAFPGMVSGCAGNFCSEFSLSSDEECTGSAAGVGGDGSGCSVVSVLIVFLSSLPSPKFSIRVTSSRVFSCLTTIGITVAGAGSVDSSLSRKGNVFSGSVSHDCASISLLTCSESVVAAACAISGHSAVDADKGSCSSLLLSVLLVSIEVATAGALSSANGRLLSTSTAGRSSSAIGVSVAGGSRTSSASRESAAIVASGVGLVSIIVEARESIVVVAAVTAAVSST